MNKFLLSISIMLMSLNAQAEWKKITFTSHKPFNEVNAQIQHYLEHCVARPFNLLQNGRKINTTNFDNDTYIYLVEEYQFNGINNFDNGKVIVSKEKHGTLVSITNYVEFIGPNLDLQTPIKRWVNTGPSQC